MSESAERKAYRLEWYHANKKRLKDKIKENNRKQYYKNPELSKEKARQYRIKNRDLIALRAKLKRYNITEDYYYGLLTKQKNRCPGCGISLKSLDPRLVHTEHCHSTGVVRGVTCGPCNTALGAVKDNKKTLKNLIIYLENAKHDAKALGRKRSRSLSSKR